MEFKNQWDTDDEKKSEPSTKKIDTKLASDLSVVESSTNETAVDLEVTNATTNTDKNSHLKEEKLASLYPTPSTSSPQPASRFISSTTSVIRDDSHKARRFLVAYITTAFSALSILYSTAWLGYVLIDHFLGPKQDTGGLFYLDLAPLYISLMASLAVFGVIYIIASRYVAKSASNDTIGLKDWRAYKVVYAFLSALLIATGASVVAGLVYIPLAQLMIADDLDSKRILVQTLASIHVLVWIGVLIWQERLVRKAKQSWLQGFVVVAGVAVVIIATGVFPVGSKTDERFDNRIATDLTAIQYAVEKYQEKNNKLPDSMSKLTFAEDSTTKNRLKEYTYTLKTSQETDKETVQQSTKVNATVLKNNTSTDKDASNSLGNTGDMSDEEYYETLYQSMYANKSSEKAQQSYELCATFRTDSTTKKDSSGNALIDSFNASSSSYSFDSHKSGKVCFDRTASYDMN